MKYFLVILLSLVLLAFAHVPAFANSSKTPYPTANPPGTGLWGEYYNGTNFQEKVYERFDDEINFYYNRESPAPGVKREYYSIRWTGSIYAPVTGTYTLSVRVDDGARVWLNGVKILDQWKLQQLTSYSGQVHLEAGNHYDIKIEYYNGPIHGIMKLMWIMPEVEEDTSFLSLFSFFNKTTPTRTPIPKQYLYGPATQTAPALAQAQVEQVEKKVVRAPEQAPKPIEKETISARTPKQEEPQPAAARQEAPRPKSLEKPQKRQPNPASELVYDRLVAEDLYDNLTPGDRIQFENVQFEQGKYLLLEGSFVELDKLVRTLERFPTLRIRIEGHTDNVGIASVNQSLSYFRAKVVATYLIEKGADPLRIEANGNGSDLPIADNDSEEGRAKNRRVEFVVK